jgi:hypothetical protein
VEVDVKMKQTFVVLFTIIATFIGLFITLNLQAAALITGVANDWTVPCNGAAIQVLLCFATIATLLYT